MSKDFLDVRVMAHEPDLPYHYGLMTGRTSTSPSQDTNSSELKTQPSFSLPSILILIHSPSGLRPSGSMISPLDKKVNEENVVLGPIRTFNVNALTVHVRDASTFRMVKLSKWIWVLRASKV